MRTENKYDDPEIWGRRSREFDLGAVGTGVAIGDYDNDGRPDIFVVSKTESCRLFRNLGNWKFEDVTEKAGVGDHGAAARIWKQGATFVDVNNDGLLDIYVCRFNAPNLLYINQGDGTFKEEAHAYGLDVKDACVMADFCDYDRDGWLDVFIQTNVLDAAAHPEGQRDYLFHNNRDGTFTNVTDRAGIAPGPTHGNSAVWWDFDGDGWPDLYVANDFAVPDALYHNNRDGTFTDVIARVVPHIALFVDGLGPRRREQRRPASTCWSRTWRRPPRRRTSARWRNPGRACASPRKARTRSAVSRSALYLNTGTGRCLEAAHLAGLAATDWTWAPLWEDLDNDGRARPVCHERDVSGDPQPGPDRAPGHGRQPSSPADRSRGTARCSPRRTSRFATWAACASKMFRAPGGLDQKGVSFGAAFGDLGGDGNLDLVYSNYQAGVTLLRNDSDTGHRIICALRGTRSNRFGVGAKVTLESAAGIQVRPLTLGARVHVEQRADRAFRPGRGCGDPAAYGVVAERRGADLREPSRRPTVHDHRALGGRAGRRREDAEREPRPPAQFRGNEPGRTSLAPGRRREEAVDEFLDQRLLPARLNRRGPRSPWATSTAADATACASAGPRGRPGACSCRSVAGVADPEIAGLGAGGFTGAGRAARRG